MFHQWAMRIARKLTCTPRHICVQFCAIVWMCGGVASTVCVCFCCRPTANAMQHILRMIPGATRPEYKTHITIMYMYYTCVQRQSRVWNQPKVTRTTIYDAPLTAIHIIETMMGLCELLRAFNEIAFVWTALLAYATIWKHNLLINVWPLQVHIRGTLK